MASSMDFDTTQRIPIINDLIIPGNPQMKLSQGEMLETEEDEFEVKLQERIDQLESTIGQDLGEHSLRRAHAIRAEDQKPEDLSDKIDRASVKHLGKTAAARLRGFPVANDSHAQQSMQH